MERFDLTASDFADCTGAAGGEDGGARVLQVCYNLLLRYRGLHSHLWDTPASGGALLHHFILLDLHPGMAAQRVMNGVQQTA